MGRTYRKRGEISNLYKRLVGKPCVEYQMGYLDAVERMILGLISKQQVVKIDSTG